MIIVKWSKTYKFLCTKIYKSLPQETDGKIQAAVRESFRGATVLAIAHRLRTVLACDRVIVMADGQVVESGPPAALAADPASAFHAMTTAEASATSNASSLPIPL